MSSTKADEEYGATYERAIEKMSVEKSVILTKKKAAARTILD